MGCVGSDQSGLPPVVKKPDDEGAIIVYSWRVVKKDNMEVYKKAAETYGATIKPPKVPGLKTYTFATNKKFEGGQTLVSDIQWFNSIGTFRAHMGLYGDMNIAKNMMAFVGEADDSEEFGHFKGYVFGAWDKTWVGPISVPTMFANFPPAKWFEFRAPAAGFIRNTESSTTAPPIHLMIEHKVKEGKVDEFVAAYKKSADQMELDSKVISMSLTKEGPGPDKGAPALIDKDKIKAKEEGFKSANLLVAYEVYEDLPTLKTAVATLGGLKDLLEGPSNGYMHPALDQTGEIWAGEHNAEVAALMKATYHPDSTYKAFVPEAGFNDHKTACDGKCPVVPEKDYCNAFSDDTPIGKTCPEELKPAAFKKK